MDNAPRGPRPVNAPLPGAVPSPCIGVCRIDEASGCCAGCLRTLDEIAVWSLLDDGEKRAVWKALGARRRHTAAGPAAAPSAAPPTPDTGAAR